MLKCRSFVHDWAGIELGFCGGELRFGVDGTMRGWNGVCEGGVDDEERE